MNIRLVVCCLAGAVILFGGAYIATAEQLSKSLPKVESALSSSESALPRIDLKVLSVQCREGKYIENARARALKYAHVAREVVARVYNEARGYDLLTLLTMLKALDSQIESLLYAYIGPCDDLPESSRRYFTITPAP
jgi:hypothetical protein